MQSQKAHIVAFRHQRAIFVFVVLGLIILFSTAVLWGHYETVITRYQWLAKAGLALVDVIAVGLAIWHLYTHHAPLKVWCYVADAVIAGMMLVHAGAVLQLDSSTARQVAQVKAAAEAQAKLREADAKVEAAKIKAAAEAASAVRRETGSLTLASRTLKTAETKQDGRAAEALTKMASEVQPKTFLSDDYMQGGVYYWPALVALFFFVVAIGISGFSVKIEDANNNGVPDALENFFGRFTAAPADQPVTAQPQRAEPPQPTQVHYRGDRSYVFLPDGRKRITQSTYSPDEVGMIVDGDADLPAASIAETGAQPKQRVVWRGGQIVEKGNGADRPH